MKKPTVKLLLGTPCFNLFTDHRPSCDVMLIDRVYHDHES